MCGRVRQRPNPEKQVTKERKTTDVLNGGDDTPKSERQKKEKQRSERSNARTQHAKTQQRKKAKKAKNPPHKVRRPRTQPDTARQREVQLRDVVRSQSGRGQLAEVTQVRTVFLVEVELDLFAFEVELYRAAS